MRSIKPSWTILFIVVLLFNTYILFQYYSSDITENIINYSIRFMMNIFAVSIAFIKWNNPKHFYVSISIALYLVGICSILYAMFVHHPPIFPWHTIVGAGFFIVAILLLFQALFLVNKSNPRMKTMSFDMIGASLLVASSLILSFASQRITLVDIIFPTVDVLAASTPAILLLGYISRFQEIEDENKIVQYIQSKETKGGAEALETNE